MILGLKIPLRGFRYGASTRACSGRRSEPPLNRWVVQTAVARNRRQRMADDLEALFRAIGTRLEELGPQAHRRESFIAHLRSLRRWEADAADYGTGRRVLSRASSRRLRSLPSGVRSEGVHRRWQHPGVPTVWCQYVSHRCCRVSARHYGRLSRSS